MLRLDGVTYRHAGARTTALRGVNVALAEGEVVGVVGANGAGKTTLCLVAAGFAPRLIGGSLTGRVEVDGADLAALPTHDVVPLVAIGFDDPWTQLSGVTQTVFEEVAFGPANLGVDREALLRRVEQAMSALAIGDLAERDPARLSGGQQQLVAIAGLLAMGARHLVLDEPTSQLDPSGTELVGAAIERLVAAGASILLVEHKTDLLARVAQRVVVLEDGAIAFEGPASEVLSDERLRQLGVTEPSDVRLRRRLREAGLEPVASS
jgi:energy-coupling factor transporter ATP-binding protein EcfA2